MICCSIAVVVENEEDQAEEQIDYEKQLDALMPSEKVWKAAPFKHHKKLKDIINELEVNCSAVNLDFTHL